MGKHVQHSIEGGSVYLLVSHKRSEGENSCFLESLQCSNHARITF